MNHYLFDALKISPVPLETANKVTETGWMLEIERLLNEIVSKAHDGYEDLNTKIYNKFEDEMEVIKKEYKDFVKEESLSSELHTMIIETINDLIEESVKYITFELSVEGKLVAKIPKHFENVRFSTNLDTDSEEYGKLVINY